MNPRVSFTSNVDPKRLQLQQAFGKKMKEARFTADSGSFLSQDTLAFKVGTTRQTILDIENGRSCPNLFLACQIAMHLGIKIDELVLQMAFENRSPVVS